MFGILWKCGGCACLKIRLWSYSVRKGETFRWFGMYGTKMRQKVIKSEISPKHDKKMKVENVIEEKYD